MSHPKAFFFAAFSLGLFAGELYCLYLDAHFQSSTTSSATDATAQRSKEITGDTDMIDDDPIVPAPENDPDPLLALKPPTESLDDSVPDVLSGRRAAFKAWQGKNAKLWTSLDSAIRSCAYIKYVNGFDDNPEHAIDECLTYFESENE